MAVSLTEQSKPAERYTVLLDLARTLASSLEPSSLYPAIHIHVARVLPTSSFSVHLMEGDAGPTEVFRAGGDREPVALDETELDHLRAGDYVLRSPAGRGGASLLAAPLVREDRLVGCVVARRRDGRPFDANDAHFLLGVGRLAGVALDNGRLFAEAKRRREEAERLEVVARDLSASLELSEVVERVAARAFEEVAKPVVVWIVDGDAVRAVARTGGALIRLGEERELPAEAAARLAAEAVAWREANEAGGATGFGSGDGVRGGAGGTFAGGPSRALVPLSVGDRLVGFIAIGPWADAPPAPEQLRFLYRMAPHAASAIENARLHGEVRRLSLTDPLVQLPNRRQLDLFLEREFAAAERGRPLCFVLFDLDRFKDYNDTFGHRAGDVALVRFADILRTETRAMNLAARYGGEEFAAVLSGTNLDGARAHAERVRRAVEREFNSELTVSAGVAAYDDTMKSPTDLVVAADRALYRAKTEGRNRVRVDGA